jgi:hypothetical protein
MKSLKLLSFVMLLASGLMFVNCTSDLDQGPAGPAGPAGVDGVDGEDGKDGIGTGSSTTVLLAKKALIGPTIDGIIDASWINAQELTVTATVPDLADKVFQGYENDSYDAIIKAQYDDEYVYFLAEWKDANQSFDRDTWYFDAVTKLWKQESNKPVFEADVKVRDAFYEDKFAMLFDVNESVTDWSESTCYASCHTGLTKEQGYARHYTEGAGQVVDMWHWKMARTNFYGTFDDQNQTSEKGESFNGRHSDAGVGPYSDNRQDLKLDGTGETVRVPKFVIPGRENNGWITEDEIANNTAKLITAVGSDGKLTLEGGGVIDPVAEVKYQRDGEKTALLGMASVTVKPVIGLGSRADIIAKGVFTGNGWILEFKRKLDTGDHVLDVTFDTTKEYPFGLGIFDNAAIAHAIKASLTLKFE